MRDVPENVVENAAEQRSAVLSARLKAALANRPPDAPLAYPVSRFARGLWFLDQLQPGGTEFVQGVVVRLSGDLDEPALKQAFQQLVSEQPAFRTTFPTGESGPVRLVRPTAVADLPVIRTPRTELTGEQLLSLLDGSAALEPFDLAAGPLFRCRLVRAPGSWSALVLLVHHLIWDAESARILVTDLAARYDAGGRGEPNRHGSPAPESPAPVASLSDDDRGGWIAGLGRTAPFVWPTPVPAPAPCAVVTRGLSADQADALRSGFAELGCTPFMVGLGCLWLALAPYRSDGAAVIGASLSVRPPAAAGTVGYYVNTLPVRVEAGPAMSGREFLHAVRDACVHVLRHRLVPLEDVVAAVAPARTVGTTPLTQVVSAYNRAPAPLRTADGLMMTLDRLPARRPKRDLEVAWNETPDGLVLRLEYDTGRLSRSVVERIADETLRHLTAFAEDLDRSVDTVSARSPEATAVCAQPDTATAAPADVPADPWYRTIVELWRDVLDVEDVREEDNFFDLGGRSLEAARLVTRLNRRLGTEIPLRLVFVTDSLTDFADTIIREHRRDTA